MYSHIIWDWNGTLLDDVDWCVEVENRLGRARGLPALDLESYRRCFTFPVIQYYRNIGHTFETESFEELSGDFIRLYHSGDAENCPLYEHAGEVLRTLSGQGYRQVILSASEKGNLAAQVSRYGIGGYFEEILGIDNIYAASKVSVGLAYLANAGVEKAVLIGDTLHDREVAEALGADCILIARGHQNRDTLLACGAPVLDDISRVPSFLLENE